MQKLLELLGESAPLAEQGKWNLCREYLQLAVLKSVYGSPAGRRLVFQGGTCLRFCHGLKRYSEDLDFSLEKPDPRYALAKLHATLLRDLARRGFEVDGKVKEEKTVQKAFVRIRELPSKLGFSFPSNQKLSIKLEIDTRPPSHGTRETHFASRWGEIFPLLKYDLPTLFAGKVLAILCRPYDRGRDYYDLIWFLSQRVEGNLAYFRSGMDQALRLRSGQAEKDARGFSSWAGVLKEVAKKVERVKSSWLLNDLKPLLEDASDLSWLRNYRQVFQRFFQDAP